MDSIQYTKQIKTQLFEWGADLAGIADVAALKGLEVHPPELLRGFTRAVSLAILLPASIFETLIDQPTPGYSVVYQTANQLLDKIAFRAAVALEKDGFHSLPIPASQVLDRENWYAAISHKAVARMAGLGWQGKSLLLVTPEYGPRVRLATILTDAPLTAGSPIGNRCGKCRLCRDACPAHAIKGINTRDHYQNRDDALDFSRCADKLTGEFAKLPGIGSPICGLCIKVCPFGRQLKKNTASE
jgi:epoxyqueuosine reductase QueG